MEINHNLINAILRIIEVGLADGKLLFPLSPSLVNPRLPRLILRISDYCRNFAGEMVALYRRGETSEIYGNL